MNPNPSALDMSLLDTEEMIDKRDQLTAGWRHMDTLIHFDVAGGSQGVVCDDSVSNLGYNVKWIQVEANIEAEGSLWRAMLHGQLQRGDSVKETAIRLFNPVGQKTHKYAFYIRVPKYFQKGKFKLFVTSPGDLRGTVRSLRVIIMHVFVRP